MTRDNPILLRQQPIIKGDKNALTWRVLVTRNGAPHDLTGATADLYCARACDAEDGEGGGTVYSEATILEGETGVVEAVLPPDAANVPGPVVCLLRIERDGAVVGVARMAVDAIDPVGSDIVDEGNRILDLGALVSAAERCEAAAAAADEAAAATTGAASSATSAAQAANTAAGSATSAASRADAAAAAIEGITAMATTLETGEQATAAVQVVDGRYVLALGLPRGLTGATPQITLQVATGAPGTDASAVVTGTPEAPHVLLTIPRGDVGKIGNLTINGKTPGADGSVTVGIDDINGLQEAINNAGGVKTVAGVSPDAAGNVPLTAADVGAVAMELLWENATPNSEMGADADGVNGIELNWAAMDYTHVLVTFAYGSNAGNSVNQSSAISEIVIGKRILLSASNAGYDAYANRGLAFADGGLHIGGASSSIAGAKTNGTANAYIIPLKVYGIKGVRTNGQ